MAQALTTYNPNALIRQDEERPPSDSALGPIGVGLVILVVFFGGLGTWAATAPLNGAVVGTGMVKIEGNRKSVQHLDGGIVKELRVKEGDKVQANDVLIVLDDTQARAEYEVLSQQFVVLRATEERLRAELTRAPQLVLPSDLASRRDDPYVKSIWDGQVVQFESRRAALEGQRSIIREKVGQLQSQIQGGEAQIKAYTAQLASVSQERDSIRPLVERGLIARPRVLQLERTGSGLEGQIGETTSSIARARQAIAEMMQQDVQLDHDRMTEVTRDLRDTQARIVEVIPKLMNATAVLGRMEIRSPYSGQVVGLNVFSVGGVIARGEKIMDVVPDRDSLVIEAQIAVEDISDLHPKMRADVHLTSYKQRINPVVQGEVIHVSADRLTDQRTGNPYYTALVRLNAEDLASATSIQLYPGMPATVMVPTVERTALDYILGPLVQSFNRAFRQR